MDFKEVGKGILSNIKDEMSSTIKGFAQAIVLVVIMAIIKSLELEKDSTISKVASIVGVFIIISMFLNTFMDLIGIMKKTINIETSIVQISSPFIMSMLILTGAISTTSLIQPIILLLVGAIGFLVNQIIVPLITISVIFSIITNISDGINLSRLSSMSNKTALWLNGIVLTIFLGLTSLQTAVSTSVDELTIKTTQTAISGVIPVVRKVYFR